MDKEVQSPETDTISKNQTSYGDEFRRDAVDLFINSSKTYAEIASELGINPNTREELAGEIRIFHKELEHVRRQRDGCDHTGREPAPQYELIDEIREQAYTIAELCEAFGLPPSGYHTSTGEQAYRQARRRAPRGEVHRWLRQPPRHEDPQLRRGALSGEPCRQGYET